MEEENKITRKATPYFDSYKARYDAHLAKKRGDRQKQQPEGIIQKAEGEIKIVEQKLLTEEQKIVQEVKEKLEGSINYVKEPKHIRILKIIAIIIPLLLISYLFYSNFVVSKDFNYFYDIGSQADAKTPYLTPLERVSDIVNDTTTYRNLTSGLVYFTVPIVRGSETMEIQTRFKDNFPQDAKMSIGAQDKEEWHYKYNQIYNPSISQFLGENNIYKTNSSLPTLSMDELKSKGNIVIASDNFIPEANKIDNWQGNTIINTSLRGAHTFYIYISGNLNLEVKKQDINWYNNSDDLTIVLYDINNNPIANTTILDDGITEVSHSVSKIQAGTLQARNLTDGVYKLEFSDFDGLIREIKVNTKKVVVANEVYLADSPIYLLENKTSYLYFNALKPSEVSVKTWHQDATQNVKINNNTINIKERVNETLYPIDGENNISSNFNDIIISYPGYFSFSKESYFEPFKQRVVPIKNNVQWLKDNVDYIVTNYNVPKQDGDWLISDTEFNIKQDNLFVSDNKLSLLFNTPPLSQEAYSNYIIPIDWINVTIHKPGLIEQWRGK